MGTMKLERVWLLGRSRVLMIVCGVLGGLVGLFRRGFERFFHGAGLAEVGVIESAGGVAGAGKEAELPTKITVIMVFDTQVTLKQSKTC